MLLEYIFKLERGTTDIAGEVVEVGSGVTKFKAGDKVVAVLIHFISHVHTIMRILISHLCVPILKMTTRASPKSP
ncbi:hypothetical protein CsSME_00043767 [Camellia sinensis var. sinensis]